MHDRRTLSYQGRKRTFKVSDVTLIRSKDKHYNRQRPFLGAHLGTYLGRQLLLFYALAIGVYVEISK